MKKVKDKTLTLRRSIKIVIQHAPMIIIFVTYVISKQKF